MLAPFTTCFHSIFPDHRYDGVWPRKTVQGQTGFYIPYLNNVVTSCLFPNNCPLIWRKRMLAPFTTCFHSIFPDHRYDGVWPRKTVQGQTGFYIPYLNNVVTSCLFPNACPLIWRKRPLVPFTTCFHSIFPDHRYDAAWPRKTVQGQTGFYIPYLNNVVALKSLKGY